MLPTLSLAVAPERVPTAAEIVQALERDGLVEGAPLHLRSWAKHIDEEVCAQEACPFCGRQGMRYRAFHRGVGLGFRYRAVCECPACGYGFEL